MYVNISICMVNVEKVKKKKQYECGTNEKF